MSKKLIAAVKAAAIDRFPMPLDGIHGPTHWERVRENAAYLAKRSGGDVLVAELFAYLHDSCRLTNGTDTAHGARAARFATTLRDDVLTLDNSTIK